MGEINKRSKLDLSKLGLKEVPIEIFKYKNLKTLNLSGNNLKTLPKELFDLNQLRSLDISNNKITSLYSGIAKLKNLKVLNLNGNFLKTLPIQIFSLSNLEKLLIANNEIKELPSDVHMLSKLRFINISSNNLNTFPLQILKINSLERLWLNNMTIDNIPIDEIKDKLPKLKGLYFYGHKIYQPKNIYQPLFDTKGNSLKTLELISFKTPDKSINSRQLNLKMKHKIFVSYSHKDEKYREEVETSLKSLTHTVEKLDFEFWDDKKIIPGTQWKKEIEDRLKGATIGILIVSRNFFASNFIMQKEVPLLLNKLQNDGTKLLVIVAGSCSYEKHFVRDYQTVNKPNYPLSSLNKYEQENVFTELERTICDIIDGKI